MPRKGIIDAMHTDDFRVAVKKFTSKSKCKRRSIRAVPAKPGPVTTALLLRRRRPLFRQGTTGMGQLRGTTINSGKYTPSPPAT